MTVTTAKEYKKQSVRLRLELQDRVDKLERALKTIEGIVTLETNPICQIHFDAICKIIHEATK